MHPLPMPTFAGDADQLAPQSRSSILLVFMHEVGWSLVGDDRVPHDGAPVLSPTEVEQINPFEGI